MEGFKVSLSKTLSHFQLGKNNPASSCRQVQQPQQIADQGAFTRLLGGTLQRVSFASCRGDAHPQQPGASSGEAQGSSHRVPVAGNWEQGEEGREEDNCFLLEWGWSGHISQGTVWRSWSGRAPSGTHPAPWGTGTVPGGQGVSMPLPSSWATVSVNVQQLQMTQERQLSVSSPQAHAEEAQIFPEQMPSTGTSS